MDSYVILAVHVKMYSHIKIVRILVWKKKTFCVCVIHGLNFDIFTFYFVLFLQAHLEHRSWITLSQIRRLPHWDWLVNIRRNWPTCPTHFLLGTINKCSHIYQKELSSKIITTKLKPMKMDMWQTTLLLLTQSTR